MAQQRQKPAQEIAEREQEAPVGSSQVARPTEAQIAKVRERAGAIAERNAQAMQHLSQWIASKVSGTDQDTFAAMAAIVGEIMEAESPEEVLRERSLLSGENFVGKPFLLHGFEIREGDYEESMLGCYAVMTISHPESEATRLLTCGALKVVVKLMMLERFNVWPQLVWITGTETRKGYTALDLATPSESAMNRSW